MRFPRIRLVEQTEQTLGYKNHKSWKTLPKFLSTLHFLQESYKFVQESQILQIWYNDDHFLQDSDNIFAKNAFFSQEVFTKNVMCYFDQNNRSSNYQQQQPQLPFTMHKLSQDPTKRV